jgi:hypothetical protein
MTILENKGHSSETQHACRFVERVECVPLLFNDFPTAGKEQDEMCKACGLIHAAVELRRVADTIDGLATSVMNK